VTGRSRDKMQMWPWLEDIFALITLSPFACEPAKAKFHYAISFEAGSKPVADQLRTRQLMVFRFYVIASIHSVVYARRRVNRVCSFLDGGWARTAAVDDDITMSSDGQTYSMCVDDVVCGCCAESRDVVIISTRI